MSSDTNPRNWFENAVFVAGLLIVLALVGTLVIEAVNGPAGPPVLRVAAEPGGDPRLVPIVVENTGGRVAEAVRVEVCTPADDCAEVELPYVPAGAERRATVGFHEPAEGALEVRVVSFLEP